MIRNLLICGLLAGVCGGLLAAGFAELAGEPPLEQAISFEEGHREKAGSGGVVNHNSGPVSRGTQRALGLPLAAVVYGLAMGGFFALAFAFAYGRVGGAGPARTALWMAAAGFVVVFLVPFLKYPANPPSIGNPETIGERTLLFFTMLATSLLAALAATRLRTTLLRRHTDSGIATVAGIAAYLAIVAIAGIAMPSVDEVPVGFPATTLWNFRIASIGTQAILWGTMGLVLALTAPRVLAGKPVLQR